MDITITKRKVNYLGMIIPHILAKSVKNNLHDCVQVVFVRVFRDLIFV